MKNFNYNAKIIFEVCKYSVTFFKIPIEFGKLNLKFQHFNFESRNTFLKSYLKFVISNLHNSILYEFKWNFCQLQLKFQKTFSNFVWKLRTSKVFSNFNWIQAPSKNYN